MLWKPGCEAWEENSDWSEPVVRSYMYVRESLYSSSTAKNKAVQVSDMPRPSGPWGHSRWQPPPRSVRPGPHLATHSSTFHTQRSRNQPLSKFFPRDPHGGEKGHNQQHFRRYKTTTKNLHTSLENLSQIPWDSSGPVGVGGHSFRNATLKSKLSLLH